ncbi:predicted protein [Histoplasma capsulatum H143]|uniref:Uncharacterized protein n=1 Tax=Ajellomyces capsulatus (strain H143) TaxID=544712 RepID=C6H4H1_AJECH|nr:predicted protein [Histoplasma capsulatum H143]
MANSCDSAHLPFSWGLQVLESAVACRILRLATRTNNADAESPPGAICWAMQTGQTSPIQPVRHAVLLRWGQLVSFPGRALLDPICRPFVLLPSGGIFTLFCCGGSMVAGTFWGDTTGETAASLNEEDLVQRW